MNEAVFLLQTLTISIAAFYALKIGKEALITLSVLYAILSNFFVLKQISLFGWNVTSSDAYAVGTLLSLNLTQQHYGKAVARKAVLICCFSSILFVLLSKIHLIYKPSSSDLSHPHFNALLTHAPRLLIASLTSFFLVQLLDVELYSYLQRNHSRMPSHSLQLISLLISQAVDTLLFTFLGLYGIIQKIGPIILFSYIVKSITIVTIWSFSQIEQRWIRKHPKQ